jgi:hypothetical protein
MTTSMAIFSRIDNYSYKKYRLFKQKLFMVFFHQRCFVPNTIKKIILTFSGTNLQLIMNELA